MFNSYNMHTGSRDSLIKRVKTLFIGRERSIHDTELFRKISLIAFFAWVGLGADGLSSSAYGPEEAFLALGDHIFLGIFVALASAFTIFIISNSYSQIIELFPKGGGGYLVASKLLSPTFGMISGCALIIDYVLTITISVAAGAAAIFSFLPEEWLPYTLLFALFGVAFLMILNLRGVRESILFLAPVFMIFIITHIIIIVYALIVHFSDFPLMAASAKGDIGSAYMELGILGMLFLVMKAYSFGAGTYTGIEAVSNGLSILREPRVKTARRTMFYMASSLAFMAVGLMIAYLFYSVEHVPGKTLNAVLYSTVTESWGSAGYIFLLVSLISEAALLFIAAQAGFIGGPRVLADMALGRWFPSRFANLSDRFVTQNGILIMGISAAVMMVFTGGSVKFLVVLYSINVFITFVLSQLGMVKHWWASRFSVADWKRKMLVNGTGLGLCAFILASVVVFKFNEGGWITLFITGSLIFLAVAIKRHYNHTKKLTEKLDHIVQRRGSSSYYFIPRIGPEPFNPKAKTAVLLVKGFNGLGLYTLKNVLQNFSGVFKNFIFLEIGSVDAGNFRNSEEIQQLRASTMMEVERYAEIMRKNGYNAESFVAVGIDVVDEVAKIAPKIIEKYPRSIFFGGQIVLPKDSIVTRLLHNYTVFAVQRRLYSRGITVVLLPVVV
mgnify:CR=1 FL=1